MPVLTIDRLEAVPCHPGFWPDQTDARHVGESWPSPRFLFAALHAALHQGFPQIQLWEHNHATGSCGRYPERHIRWQRFGSLTSVGPFPQLGLGTNGRWLFASPHDVRWNGHQWLGASLVTMRQGEKSSLPPPLTYLPQTSARLGSSHPCWWSKPALEAYLAGQPSDASHCVVPSEIYQVQVTGLKRAAEGSIEGRFSGNGSVRLWLKDQVALGGWASMPLKEMRYQQGLDHLFQRRERQIAFGAAQHWGRVRVTASETLERWLPVSHPAITTRVKWLLLAPAVFPAYHASGQSGPVKHPGGWLPNWVCPLSGRVQLRKGAPSRGGMSREDWRARVREAPGLDCRLVACSVAGAVTISGWKEGKGLHAGGSASQPGPRTAWLGVPAGTVYYFEGPDAPALAEMLAWHGGTVQNADRVDHRRSTLFGEQGFGVGVCGVWDYSTD
jgi:CRISPR-associated protein Cmr3